MNKSRLGRAVRALRERKSWTVPDLAKEARIKPETLSALEQGTRHPRSHTIRAIARALATTPEQLYDLADELARQSATPAEPPAVDIESLRAFRLLAERTRITANRTNLVRVQSGLPQLTLADGLYVRRDIEAEILRLAEDRNMETNLIVVEGEPGTGKSSLLWSVQKRLAERMADAWLVDAIELPAVFRVGGIAGTILSADVLALFETMNSAGRPPVLLIDTVDVALNTKGKDDHLISLLSELTIAGVRVLVASRPGEARKLVPLGCRVLRLMEYSDDEFFAAVSAYARAFISDADSTKPEAHAAALLEAAAQGYPIKEICRNPLTLRMLYTVYAPQRINVAEIDVVSLYRAFWRRRVESDVRTDGGAAPASELDLSASAMRTALTMLVEGLPDLPMDILTRELETAGLSGRHLHTLDDRGVLRVSDYGTDRHVGFFHQTFFEHAAALAILRLGGVPALQALMDRWALYDGNLFLGATLERALVLAELEVLPVREGSERIMLDLLNHGAPGLAVLVYVYVHRAAIPASVDDRLRERVRGGDAVVVERLLDLAGNATRGRRAALIDLLSVVIDTGKSRWLRRVLELLMRFAAPDIELVAKVLKTKKLGPLFIDGADKYPQARDLFLEFLRRYFPQGAEWTVDQCAFLFSDAVRRRADRTALQLLAVLEAHAVAYPQLASAFERKAAIDQPDAGDMLTSADVAEVFGRLFHVEWAGQGLGPRDILAELQARPRRGLSLTARLNGLVPLLVEGGPAALTEAFQMSAATENPTVRAMLARITWSKVLPQIAASWPPEAASTAFRALKDACGPIFAQGRNAAADIALYVLGHAPLSDKLAALMLSEDDLSDPAPWLETTALGRRLIEGCAAGIDGARKAMQALIKAPEEHPHLAQAALAQMRFAEHSADSARIGMALAIRMRNADAALRFLQQQAEPMAEWREFAPTLRHITSKLRSFGDVRARRQAISIELEVVRLRLDDTLDWASLLRLLQHETDDTNQALLIQALGHTLYQDRRQVEDELETLIRFAKQKGPKARSAVIEILAQASYGHPDFIATFIYDLFDLGFGADSDGSIIAKLLNPMFVLYQRSDPRVPALAEALVDRCAPLSTQSCRRVCAKLRNLFSLIMRRMDHETRGRLLAKVPGLDRYLARMIVQGAGDSATADFARHLKAIMEDPATHAEIVTLARRFLRRELRTSGLERWPELYGLVASA